MRTDIHLARRLYHSLGVCIILALYMYLPRDAMIYLFCFCTVLCITLDIGRQKIRPLNAWLTSKFGVFLRKNEVHSLTGMSFMTLGILTISVVFPSEVVKLSLLMLAFADPIASIVGILYGKDKLIGNKSLQGSLAGLCVCAVLSGIYFYAHSMMVERLILASLICGIIGAVCELIPILDLDDNFTFPILSSCLLWIFFHFLNGI